VPLIAGDFNHANLHDCSSEILPACKNALDYCHTTHTHDCQTDQPQGMVVFAGTLDARADEWCGTALSL